MDDKKTELRFKLLASPRYALVESFPLLCKSVNTLRCSRRYCSSSILFVTCSCNSPRPSPPTSSPPPSLVVAAIVATDCAIDNKPNVVGCAFGIPPVEFVRAYDVDGGPLLTRPCRG